MAQVLRPLCCFRSTFHHRLLSPFLTINSGPQKQKPKQQLPYATPPSPLDFQSRGLRLIQTPLPLQTSDLQENISDSEFQEKKSRNQKKREARKAFQWGLELATFSEPQIKRILRVASLDQEVFNAIMLVKRLGPDVREGKRRQFNYIGRLLREVQPELMDALIQASKDGDQSKFQELSGTETSIIEEDEEEGEIESEEEGEGNFTGVASRWFEGLIDKDSDITNEVYSIHSVDFDRQELRKLVRRVHSIQCCQISEENKGEDDAALAGAKKSLIGFLHTLAKQMQID